MLVIKPLQQTPERIQSFIKKLEDIYYTAENLYNLEHEEHRRISIRCEKLKLKNDGTYAMVLQPCFFHPSPPTSAPIKLISKRIRTPATMASLMIKLSSLSNDLS